MDTSNNNSSGVAPVVERNIEALLAQRRKEEMALGWPDKVATIISRFSGSITFLFLHVVIIGLWVVDSLGWLPGVPRYDPTLVRLGATVSVFERVGRAPLKTKG
jgi:uncharacterized membrane protein